MRGVWLTSQRGVWLTPHARSVVNRLAAADGKPRTARLSALQSPGVASRTYVWVFRCNSTGKPKHRRPRALDARVSNTAFGNIGDETVWLGRHAGMSSSKQTAPFAAESPALRVARVKVSGSGLIAGAISASEAVSRRACRRDRGSGRSR